MTMKRWEQLYVELQRKAEKLGYDAPSGIGSDNSQTVEYRIGKKPVLLIAYRDLGLKPSYSTPNRLWAEGLDLVLKRYMELAKQSPPEKLPRAIAIVVDNIGNSYVVVTMNELFELYIERIKTSNARSRKFTFVVERRGEKYFLVVPHGHPEVPLLNVSSMDSIVSLLKELRNIS